MKLREIMIGVCAALFLLLCILGAVFIFIFWEYITLALFLRYGLIWIALTGLNLWVIIKN